MSRRDLPEWEQRLRAELAKEDANRLILYDVWHGNFDGDATAPQLIRYLTKRGYKWAAVHRNTMRRWMAEVSRVVVQHRPAGA